MNATTITAEPGLPYVVVEREFDATPAALFRAHTDPDLVRQWLGPRDIEVMRIEEWDARTGGSYRYVHSRGSDEFVFRGVFHTVTPDELIVMTFEWLGEPGVVSIGTYTVADLGGGRTLLTTRSAFPTVEARDGMIANGMERGVRDGMDRLTELLAQS